MLGRKAKSTVEIDSLIGISTTIEGNVHFKGGMRIDGYVKGNVIADTDSSSMLIISEHAKVDGEVRATHVIVNGAINGAVFSTEMLELEPKARINGDVNYKALEMQGGALVSGKLTHDQSGEPVLKLAMSNT